MQAHTWILVADGARARIFETDTPDTRQLTEIQDFANTAAKGRNAEEEPEPLRRFGGGGESGSGPAHTGEPAETPAERAIRTFSNDVGDFLDQACTARRYKKLILVAPPKFLGAMRKTLSKETRDTVDKEIVKDITWLDERDITAYVNAALH